MLLCSVWRAASMQPSSSAAVNLVNSLQSVVGKQRGPLALRRDDLLVWRGLDIAGMLRWRQRPCWSSGQTCPDGCQDEQTTLVELWGSGRRS